MRRQSIACQYGLISTHSAAAGATARVATRRNPRPVRPVSLSVAAGLPQVELPGGIRRRR
jgi:hypothetical protein